ncbi:MAG: prepilin-type N-terminal cleavage/methylation domain-containing protein [Longibaculum sp.]
MQRIYRNNHNGFTLVEVLLSLSITLIIVISLTGFYQTLSHSQKIKDFHEDIYIAAKQVSQYTLGHFYKEIGDELIYVDQDLKEITISLDNHRIVKKPGFEILATHIDSLSFKEDNQKIMMHITRDEQDYHFLINFAREYQDNETVEE